MNYTVVILQDNEYARPGCATLEEAQRVQRSFVNYGKCQKVTIEEHFGVDEDIAGQLRNRSTYFGNNP